MQSTTVHQGRGAFYLLQISQWKEIVNKSFTELFLPDRHPYSRNGKTAINVIILDKTVKFITIHQP